MIQLKDKPKELQKAVFLNAVGLDAFRTSKTLDVPTGQDADHLDTVIMMFDDYATQYTSVICERYGFNTRSQKPDETTALEW